MKKAFIVGIAGQDGSYLAESLLEKGYEVSGIIRRNSVPENQQSRLTDEIRNNLGNWPVEHVDSGLKSKSNAVHAFKDRKMSKIADSGLMIWDCNSAGTLSNVIDLLGQGKNCFIWVAPDSDLYQFDNSASLEKWMENYSEVRDEALKRLSTFHKREVKRVIQNSQPDLFG